VREAFEHRHEREYFGKFAELPVLVVNVRVTGVGRMPEVRWPRLPEGAEPVPAAEEPVVFDGPDGPRRLPTRIVRRDALRAGAVLDGPAIIEQTDSTTVVPPGAQARVDGVGNIVLRFEEA
jgi:5-oxoprolinase (ATP-hydrolysing)/N-methylhydantoinase A